MGNKDKIRFCQLVVYFCLLKAKEKRAVSGQRIFYKELFCICNA
jgi:hypothetical protein